MFSSDSALSSAEPGRLAASGQRSFVFVSWPLESEHVSHIPGIKSEKICRCAVDGNLRAPEFLDVSLPRANLFLLGTVLLLLRTLVL